MYALYIANKYYSSWSLRPWILMKECGIPFEECLVPFEHAENRKLFKAYAPNAQMPCLHDDDLVIWDSLGIAQYLAERHENIWPQDAKARAWAQSAAAEIHSSFFALRHLCPVNCGLRVALYTIPEAAARDIERIDEIWRDGLDRFGGPFLASASFTAVDAFYAPVCFRIQTYGLPFSPQAMAYNRRMLDRPTMLDWYEAGLREPYRESHRDQEPRNSGTVTADYRVSGRRDEAPAASPG
jgi:glutathione S-transferase